MNILSSLVLLFVCSLAFSSADPTLCDKYKGSGTGAALLNSVVGATFTSVTTPGTPTKRYFDGTFPWGNLITNYTDPANSATLGVLVNHLVEFFGLPTVLDCTDGTTGNYTGRNLTEAHRLLPIGNTAFNYFNNALIQVLNSSGVVQADLVAIAGVLESTRSAVCNQADCFPTPPTQSICDRYANALGLVDQDLVSAIVAGVLANVTNPSSPILKYFNGSTGLTDYTNPANSAQLTVLTQHLVEFFGMNGVLSCSAGNFPAYTGRTLQAAHASMQITQSDFEYFNQVVLGVATAAGVTAADGATVATVLESTKSQVCTACAPATTTTAASTAATATTASTATTAATASTAASTTASSTTSKPSSDATNLSVPSFVFISSVVVLLLSAF